MSPSNHPRRVLTALVTALLLVPLAVPAAAVPATAVTVPDDVNVGAGATADLTGLEIIGFDAGANVLVTIAVGSGDLGATASGAASATDDDDLLRISGNPADVNATLATVTYTAGGSIGTVSAEVSVLVTDGEPALNTANGHWYEFVNVGGGITWTDARAAATARSLGGEPGYLVTVTSQDENDFVEAKLTADGWMGATDKDIEGDWVWVDGPEAGQSLTYTNWAFGEPNNASDEDGGQFYSTNYGLWNDLPHTGHTLPGYVVEYGGLGDGVEAAATGAFSITVYDAPDAPSGLTARGGDRSVDLGWTAPAGDEPVTGYQIDISDDGGDTWTTAVADTGSTETEVRIGDLDNGTEYVFRVRALNDAGTSEWSDTAMATPRQPAPACSYNSTSYSDLIDGWTVPCWTAPTSGDTATDATADWQQDGIAFGIANGLVVPTAAGEVGADRKPSRAEVAEMLHTLAGNPLSTESHDFDDVPVSSRAAVDWLVSLGITEGVSADGFGADQLITRAQLVTLIWRMNGSPESTSGHGFADDIPAWSEEAVAWAHATGIITGRNATTFDPNGSATTAEVLVVLYRWAMTLG